MTAGSGTDTEVADVDLLLLNGVIVTMDDERRIYSDGSVAIVGDRIVGVGRTAEILDRVTARRTIDMAGGVLQPGFVDGHVHLSQHLGRGTIPDVWPEAREHEQWLPYWLQMSEDDGYLSALLACLEMAHNGTTTFCDMGGRFRAEISARAAHEVGLRGFISEVCWDLPPHESVAVGDTEACLRRLRDLADRFPAEPGNRLWAGIGLAGMGQCSDQLLQGAKAIAADIGSVLYFHQSFGLEDVAAYQVANNGLTAVEHLDELGVLDQRTSLVHMIRTQERELEILMDRRTSVIHCPSASTRVGMGSSIHGRFPEMLVAGINVALGSDSGNYSDYLDVGREAYLAATIHREARGIMPTISAEQAMEMATVNGAVALGLADLVGSIEPGKKADLVLHRYGTPELRPGLRVINSLIYAAQATAVDLVLVDGEVIVEHGRSTKVDEASVFHAIDAAAARLFERMDYNPGHLWPLIS